MKAIHQQHYFVMAGFIVSLLFLLAFGIAQNFDYLFLKLPNVWFIVSAVPLLLSLLMGGFIYKIGFGSFQLELSPEQTSELIIGSTTGLIDNLPEIMKGGPSQLDLLNREDTSRIKIINFEQDWGDQYSENMILEYLSKLINVRYFRIIRDGNSDHFLSINALKGFPEPQDGMEFYPHGQEISPLSPIKRFINNLADDKINSYYGEFSSDLVVRNDDALDEILKKMYFAKVRFVGVLNSRGEFLGIIEAKAIEKEISKAYLKLRN